MKLDAGVVRSLERILNEELAQCDLYIGLLFEEQKSVVALKPDQVNELGLKRAAAVDNLSKLRDQRVKLIATITGSESVKVSDLIQSHCSPSDKKRLLPLVQKLKQRITHVEDKSREFNQVVNFSLGLVNGSLSILWSATQSVTKGYNAFGTVTESIQPTAPRIGSSLGRA